MTTNKRTITLGAAQLLGAPFRWGNTFPMRFIHTEAGVRLRTYMNVVDGWVWDEAYRGNREGEVNLIIRWFVERGPAELVEGLPTDDAY